MCDDSRMALIVGGSSQASRKVAYLHIRTPFLKTFLKNGQCFFTLHASRVVFDFSCPVILVVGEKLVFFKFLFNLCITRILNLIM